MGHQSKSGGAPNILTGEADIDVSVADYTSAQALLTIAPAAGYPVDDVIVMFDLAKATTGFAAGYTTQTLLLTLQRKVDGTNWRDELPAVHTAITGTNAAGKLARINVGTIGPNEQARIMATLSAETANDAELPYAINFRGAAPVVTAVAAA